MDAQTQDVVRWLLLVGGTAAGAVLAELAQQRWWRDAPEGRRPGVDERSGPAQATAA